MHCQTMRELRPERWHAFLRRLARTADRFAAVALGSRRTAIAALVSSCVFRGAHLLNALKQDDDSRGLLSGKREQGLWLARGHTSLQAGKQSWRRKG